MVAEPGADSVYKSHSGSIVETSEDLKAKDESQMAEERQIEVTASHNFQMRQQFLEDELKFDAQDLEAAKHSLGEAQGQLTADTADLKMTADALAEDAAILEDAKQDCQAKAVEFEALVKSRSEELEALPKAQTVISEKTGGAESFSYGLTQTSFLQLSRSVLSPSGGLAKFGAVRKIRELAKSEHSLELAQLASRVASAMHAETSTGGVNTHVQHVVDTVKVEKPEIINQTVQKSIIQEKTRHVEIQVLQIVKKTVEIPGTLLQFTDKVVDNPVVVQRQIPIVVRTVQKITDIPQLQCIDKVIDVPVGLVAQVPLVRVVAETTEISQLACETCVKDNIFMIAREINVAGKCHHETVVRGIAQNLSSVGSKWLNRGSMQQQQHQDKPPQATRQQPRKEEEEEKGRGEREKGRKGQRGSGQEGRKEEEKEAEDGGEQVENDVTGWTEVTRKKRRKTVQIFVKMDGGKTSAMETEMNDKVDDILKKIPISDQDVYVTSVGRILRRSDKLKSCEVRDGSTVEVTSRMRGGGRHKDKKSKSEKKQTTNPEKPEQMRDGESRSDEGPEMITLEEAQRILEEDEGYQKNIERASEGSEGEVQQNVQNYLAHLQKVSWMNKEQLEHLGSGVWRAVEGMKSKSNGGRQSKGRNKASKANQK